MHCVAKLGIKRVGIGVNVAALMSAQVTGGVAAAVLNEPRNSACYDPITDGSLAMAPQRNGYYGIATAVPAAFIIMMITMTCPARAPRSRVVRVIGATIFRQELQ